MILAFQCREAVWTDSVGATSAIAGLVMFVPGPLAALRQVKAAVAADIATATLPAFPAVLHDFALRHGVTLSRAEGFQMKSPLDLVAALQMVASLAAVGLIAGLLRAQFGDAGPYIVTAVSSLVDLDAITVTVLRLGDPAQIATRAIVLATAVNLLVKAVLIKAVLAPTLGGRISGRAFPPATGLAGGTPSYWCRSASIGSSLAARRAGK